MRKFIFKTNKSVQKIFSKIYQLLFSKNFKSANLKAKKTEITQCSLSFYCTHYANIIEKTNRKEKYQANHVINVDVKLVPKCLNNPCCSKKLLFD